MILEGGKYLEIKASLHLFQESILFLGKDENQVLARSLSENGNSFSLTISLSTSFFFWISHKSTKLFRWVAASSLGRAGELIFHDKIQQSSINFTRFGIGKRSNRSAKEIIIIGIVNHTIWYYLAPSWQAIQHASTQKASKRERRTGKRGRIKWQGWSGGEENERQMENNVNVRGVSLWWVLGMSWLERRPPRQRRQKSFLLCLELALVFLEEERVMQQ